jgi:hypothetical protein
MAFVDFNPNEDKRYQNFTGGFRNLTGEESAKISEIEGYISRTLNNLSTNWYPILSDCVGFTVKYGKGGYGKEYGVSKNKCRKLTADPLGSGAKKNVFDTVKYLEKYIKEKQAHIDKIKAEAKKRDSNVDVITSPDPASSNSLASMFKKVNPDGTTSPNYLVIGGIAVGLLVVTIVGIKLMKR